MPRTTKASTDGLDAERPTTTHSPDGTTATAPPAGRTAHLSDGAMAAHHNGRTMAGALPGRGPAERLPGIPPVSGPPSLTIRSMVLAGRDHRAAPVAPVTCRQATPAAVSLLYALCLLPMLVPCEGRPPYLPWPEDGPRRLPVTSFGLPAIHQPRSFSTTSPGHGDGLPLLPHQHSSDFNFEARAVPVVPLGLDHTTHGAAGQWPDTAVPFSPEDSQPSSQVLPKSSSRKKTAGAAVLNETAALRFCQRGVKGGGASRVPLLLLGMPLHLSPAPNRRLVTAADIFLDASSATKDRGLAAARRLLPKSAAALTAKLRGRSCAVVGNSGNLLQGRHGADIDRHSVVFRVNQAPTRGYEAHVGSRTHFRLLNAKWTEDYSNDRQSRLPLEKGVALVASRGTQLVQNFRRLVARVQRAGRMDVQMTLLQYQAVARTRNLLRAFKKCVEASGSKFPPGSVPTSGLVLIANIMDVCSTISVFGFGSAGKKGMRRPSYQYFSGLGSRPFGNPTHSFAGEMHLINSLANSDYVRFCNAGSCTGTGRNKS